MCRPGIFKTKHYVDFLWAIQITAADVHDVVDDYAFDVRPAGEWHAEGSARLIGDRKMPAGSLEFLQSGISRVERFAHAALKIGAEPQRSGNFGVAFH